MAVFFLRYCNGLIQVGKSASRRVRSDVASDSAAFCDTITATRRERGKVRRSSIRSGLRCHVWSEGDGETRTSSAIRSVLTGLEGAEGCGCGDGAEWWRRPLVTVGRGRCWAGACVIYLANDEQMGL